MKHLLKFSSLLGLFLLLGTISQAQEVLVDVDKDYPGIKTIEVSGGWLDVSYVGGSDVVHVEAFLQSNDDRQDIVFVTLGDVLKISYKRESGNYSWNNRSKGFINITGPENINIQIKNSSGNLEVQNVSQDLTKLSVTSGRISAQNLQGDLDLRATSGSIQVDGVSGSVAAYMTSGNADISDVDGSLTYESTSGSLTAETIKGAVEVELTSGNARLTDVGELGRLRFTSGNVRAENAGLGANTSFSGSSGNFRVKTTSNLKDFNFDLRASSGNLTVGNISTGKTLEINNNSSNSIKGNITSGSIVIEN
ncbi:DUF4097 family beta strand repeat-containing protein [Algoriphagus hitonicola]|uniref:DUF4097 and DUF4098 domain-containing protein YvlB n=1 Tax=Algoriphagus hitonicola TaxID=435880 RepID=A0A1I2P1Z2_9BACT|nr:DUF4097 family beta strand repeat-containing protein [Algoriphagus hitonicola]SFG07646.1 DUF4097 and DUF4098 domain-containing protein YvlB [Algoriphagus hitonicola]